MKKLLFLLLPLLLLCACGEAPTVRETVCDVVETEVAAPEAYTILLAIPSDTELLPRSPARTETVYAQAEGLYEIETRRFLASSPESAIHQLSGFRAADLQVVEFSRFSMPEYRFAWYCPEEDGGRICCADLFCDGQQCYAVTVRVREDAARPLWQLATEVFSTVGLFTDEGA